MARPVIAITGPARGALGPRMLVAAAVRWYGGTPLQMRPGQYPEQYRFDGVVVTGGHDVEPVLYAAEPEVVPRYDRERDAFESAMIRHALEHRLPLLGICRGAQLLNVCRGGSLIQDLRPHRNQTSHRRTVLPLKTLLVAPETRLADWIRCPRCRINSLHNQAIDRLGSNLRVAGRDLDDIVQAVEDPDYPFLLGVQWHPEFLILMRRQRRLFGLLVEAARAGLDATACHTDELRRDRHSV